MSCIEVTTKKYQTRKGPPYHAKDCKGQTKKGNDGKEYISATDKRGIYKWVPKERGARVTLKKKTMKAMKTTELPLFVLYTFAPDRQGESWDYGSLPTGWWWVGSGSADGTGYEQEEQFSGPKTSQSKMRKFLETFFEGLKKKGILTSYAIRSSYPKH